MPLGVVGSLDNLTDMTGAIFTSLVAVVVQHISHGIASSERVEVRVDGNLVQVPTDVVELRYSIKHVKNKHFSRHFGTLP